jgi:hypothetical protein
MPVDGAVAKTVRVSDDRFDWDGKQPRRMTRRDKTHFAVIILLLLGLLGLLAVGVSAKGT